MANVDNQGRPILSANERYVHKPISVNEPYIPPMGHVSYVENIVLRELADRRRRLQDNEDLLLFCVLANGNSVLVNNFYPAGSNLFVVEGELDEDATTVLVHQASLQLVMRKVTKKPEEPRRRIGFRRPDEQP